MDWEPRIGLNKELPKKSMASCSVSVFTSVGVAPLFTSPYASSGVAHVSRLSHFVYLVICLFCIGCFLVDINTWKRFSHFMFTPIC